MATWKNLRATVALGLAIGLSTAAFAEDAAPKPETKPDTKTATPATTAAKATTPKPPAPKKPVLIPGTGSVAKGATDDFEDEKIGRAHV